MGVVYHAIDPNIGRPVAIKTIQLGGKPEDRERMRDRLFREARSAGILSHPGIVTIYDVDQQGDLAYIAMEYVDGATLDHLITPDQALAPERIFNILAQIAAALDYAHHKGIVHRDIKPANIMIAADGTAKITDFGIAKITSSEQFTVTGAIVGTPHYMSPEQVQGKKLDGRSDQFSLAVMAFELLTGDKPYPGESLTTVVYRIVAEEPVPPRQLNPSLAGPIEAVLKKGLAKKPGLRYRTAQEFVDALEKACAATRGWRPMPRGSGLGAATAVDAAKPPAPPARPVPKGEAATEKPAPKSKFAFRAFLFATLLAAVLLGLSGWQADPALPEKVWDFSHRIPAILGLGGAARQPEPAASAPFEAAPAPGAEVEPKPSSMPRPAELPAPAEAEPTQPDTATKSAIRPGTLPVGITSSPAGALATLDGRADVSCSTPCSLDAPPGRHAISLTMQGYQPEQRDVDVGSRGAELPLVAMRASSGTLMLTSLPDGATITIDGRRIPQTTPAQISLAPGNHTVMVEKGGKQASSSVEIRNGAMSYVKVALQ